MEKLDLESKLYLKKLGLRIRSLRKQKKLRQVELAYHCDIEKQSMSRIETGQTNPTVLTLRKIAKALEIDVSEFFSNI